MIHGPRADSIAGETARTAPDDRLPAAHGRRPVL